MNNLFEVLFKRIGTISTQITNILREFKVKFGGSPKFKKIILRLLRQFWKKKNYQKLSDSEHLDIIKETYKLDPQFFMTFIYPKMKSWKFPSFLSLKEEIITLVDTLSTEGLN